MKRTEMRMLFFTLRSVSFFKKKSIEKKMRERATAQKDDATVQHWSLFEEGHLLVDMYETPDTIVVRSFVAGVEPENLEISMHHDMLTIRGMREDAEVIHDDRFFHRECYWGTFSRSIIIPHAIDHERMKALFKNGVVTILLPKIDLLADETPFDEEPSREEVPAKNIF